jgi:hypothetical protein
MKPAARAALALCAALALLGLLAALAAGGALLWGLLQHTVQIAIDGQPVELPAWAWPEGVVVGAAVLLGGVLVLLLPLAVLLGLGLPVLVVVVVAGALLGSLGLALAAMLLVPLAPLLGMAWLLRRRRTRRAAAGAARATMSP